MVKTVVLIDDQVLFVESLRSVIENRADDFRVTGVFYSAESAFAELPGLAPDLILMDVRMPGIDGVQAAQRVLAICPETKVMMLTTYDEDDYVSQAVEHGAVGYLLKDMPPDTLITCMRSALTGQFQIPQRLLSRFVGGQGETDEPDSSDLPEWLYELSRKERTILRLVVEGQNNDEIAATVYLAPQTVKNYISKLYSKADVDSRVHLIRVARAFIQYL